MGLGSAIGGGASAAAAYKAAKLQIKWERERAQNAHQWEVQDLQKAGLNPILSNGGSGAVTGGISAPDMSGIARAGEGLDETLTTAIDFKRLLNETKKNNAEVDQINATTNNTDTDTKLKEAQSTLTTAQTASEMERRGLISKQTATEISKQALMYAQAQQVDIQTKATIQKLEKELNHLDIEIQKAKEEKDYTKAKRLQQEYENKNQKITYWFDKAERLINIGTSGVNSAAALIKAINPIGL